MHQKTNHSLVLPQSETQIKTISTGSDGDKQKTLQLTLAVF